MMSIAFISFIFSSICFAVDSFVPLLFISIDILDSLTFLDANVEKKMKFVWLKDLSAWKFLFISTAFQAIVAFANGS